MENTDQVRDALAKIAEIANSVIHTHEHSAGHDHDHDDDHDHGAGHDAEGGGVLAPCGCVVKPLPSRLLIKSAMLARAIHPGNAPIVGASAPLGSGSDIMAPAFLAVLTSKYWGPQLRQLTVSFMESTPADLKNRILSHMNAWNKYCGISFVLTSGVGDVRISRAGAGYWSYLGTDIRLIPKNKPTMNLQGFTMNTPESEYRRVVRHETGHTMGFPHEHMRKALIDRIDRNKAYAWFLKTYNWDKATVDAQVLTPLSEASIIGTVTDQTSIMCYQLPGEITKDGKPIIGGSDINALDGQFAGKIYPKAGRSMVYSSQNGAGSYAALAAHMAEPEDWPESEDPEVSLE